MMNTSMNAAMNTVSMNNVVNFSSKSKRVTQKEIALSLGVSPSAVSFALSDERKNLISRDLREKILSKAEEMGYAKYAPMQKNKYYWNGNFTSQAAEHIRMKELREEGYTNAQIAKKVGRGVLTVRRAIGSQPAEYTAESRKVAGKRRHEDFEIRRRQALAAKLAQFREMQEEAKIMQARQEELAAERERLEQMVRQAEETYSKKVLEINSRRKEAEKAAKSLGVAI